MNEPILVTGAAGFIGFQFGAPVYARRLDRPRTRHNSALCYDPRLKEDVAC